jgi:hypothetical protein
MALSSWRPAAVGSFGRWPILTESMTDVARSGWSHWRTITEGSRSSISKETKTKPLQQRRTTVKPTAQVSSRFRAFAEVTQ